MQLENPQQSDAYKSERMTRLDIRGAQLSDPLKLLEYHCSMTPSSLTHLCPPLRSTFAVQEIASLGTMGEPWVPPLNPSETIVLSEHYRL